MVGVREPFHYVTDVMGQQLVWRGRGSTPSVQGQGLKRGGRDGGMLRKSVLLREKAKKAVTLPS